MFYIFEMANNHQGSVAHAKLIIDEFAKLAKEKGITAAIKLQFRQLDSFIHDDFKQSDLKFVKRFNSTRLSKHQFHEIIKHIESNGLVSMATPFDNESIPWLDELNVSVVKVASCSIDDWVLLRELCHLNKKIIISTGGATYKTLKKVYDLFKHHKRDFVFMHCIGEYPTPHKNSNLKRITKMREMFPDIEIGISTHESPLADSVVPLAVAMGCTVVEKHVGVPTEEITLNAYSNTVNQMASVIDKVIWTLESIKGESTDEVESLRKLKRGIYCKQDIPKGKVLEGSDFFYAMPVQDNQLNASSIDKIIGKPNPIQMNRNQPVHQEIADIADNKETISKITQSAKDTLHKSSIAISGMEKAEISCHYGLERFGEFGTFIVDKINREYCKKLIIMSPGQKHPTHHHIQKEEAFELLSGDCSLVLEGKQITMKPGKPIVIARGIRHSFSSVSGCVVEEVSTTHVPGDSVYEDPKINSLKL